MNDVDKVITACREWAEKTQREVATSGIYIFGSTINRSGDQFDCKESDIDMVVVAPTECTTALSRFEWLEKLHQHKSQLEIVLLRTLGRSDAGKPIVSIVAVTGLELRENIHKSGVRNFFEGNTFLDLLKQNAKPNAISIQNQKEIPEHSRQAIQFVQGIRNKFLGVSPSGQETLMDWDDKKEPLPKELIRAAALATTGGTDVQEGLDQLTKYLLDMKQHTRKYEELSNWLSVRRGARGKRNSLTPTNYLLMAEIVFDLATSTKVKQTAAASHADSSQEESLSNVKPPVHPHPSRSEIFTKQTDLRTNQTEPNQDSQVPTEPTDMLKGLDSAMEKFKELASVHSNVEVLAICADQIAEYLRKQKEAFFIGKQFQFLVLDDRGSQIALREDELKKMGSREAADYDIRAAIRGKINDLRALGGPGGKSILIKQYDIFPIIEAWFFNSHTAIIGLVQSHCPTREQPFLICKSPSPLFLWARRYYDYVNSISYESSTLPGFTNKHVRSQEQIDTGLFEIKKGQAGVHQTTDAVIALLEVHPNQTATLKLTLPGTSTQVEPRVTPGTVWNFEYKNIRYRAILLRVNFALDNVTIQIRPL